jgi:quercetin dioxygenase-like cupin family protein
MQAAQSDDRWFMSRRYGAFVEESSQPIILRNLFGANRNYDALDWQPFRTGIDIVRLYGTPQQGPSAALLRYAPGAQLPHHSHTGYEHIIVLSGSQRDESGRHAEGAAIINPPGSGHSVSTENGCVVLAIWEHPVIFSEIVPTAPASAGMRKAAR